LEKLVAQPVSRFVANRRAVTVWLFKRLFRIEARLPLWHAADMIRGAVAGFAVTLLGMSALFAANFALMQISPEHYRRVLAEAVDSGTLATVMHLPLAPGKEIYRYGGNDCIIVGALAVPRGSRIEASVSPPRATWGDTAGITSPPGYPPAADCLRLAATMRAVARAAAPDLLLERAYTHRYIHGDVTVAGLLLAFMSLGTASAVMLAACYAILAAVTLLALLRLRVDSSTERRRAAAFLIIAATLACFYGLPLFGRSFSFAPDDFVILAFILYGMLQPLGQIRRPRFIFAAAAFGTMIAILEGFTGAIPIGLASLIALIALGEAPDQHTLTDRMVVGTATFAAAIVACFGYKLLAVAAVFGTNEFSDFLHLLGHRMGGSVQYLLSDNTIEALQVYRIDQNWIDANIVTRVLFAGVMLTYSSFFLGWGSHLLGAALVLLPTPLLLAFGLSSFRERNISNEARERVALAAAGMVPLLWYILFANHTILHSSYMVRPLALNVALCIVSALLCRHSSAKD
jgi:hypothetical protein